MHEKPIAVREISSVSEAGGCQSVFVNSSARDRWSALSSFLENKEVLTVSDFDGFAKSGGMIEFARSGDHVGALLNMDAVTAAHLKVEGRLLHLVEVVHGHGKG